MLANYSQILCVVKSILTQVVWNIYHRMIQHTRHEYVGKHLYPFIPHQLLWMSWWYLVLVCFSSSQPKRKQFLSSNHFQKDNENVQLHHTSTSWMKPIFPIIHQGTSCTPQTSINRFMTLYLAAAFLICKHRRWVTSGLSPWKTSFLHIEGPL